MTTIVAYQRDGEIWIGADSRVSSGENFIFPTVAQKWQSIGNLWIAVTGSCLTDALIWQNREMFAAARTTFAVWRQLVAIYKEHDYQTDKDVGPPAYSGNALVVMNGEISEIASTGSIIMPSWGFLAAGSGGTFAYGAAHALHGRGLAFKPSAVVWGALEAAAEFDPSTGGKLWVKRVSPNDG